MAENDKSQDKTEKNKSREKAENDDSQAEIKNENSPNKAENENSPGKTESDKSQGDSHGSPGKTTRSLGLWRRIFNKIRSNRKKAAWTIGLALLGVLLVGWILGIIWSREPAHFNVLQRAQRMAEQRGEGRDGHLVTGYVTTATLIQITNTLLEKGGGYLSNDKLPPTALVDDMPNWEFGVLAQVRDFSRAMRDDICRSQTQSVEDKDLAEAHPKFNFDNNSWLFPSSESQYRKGIGHLEAYLTRLADEDATNAQFYARADNLGEWLKTVEKKLGSLSQRLSASVGQNRLNTDLAGEPGARQSKPTAAQMRVTTPWMEIDDVFYEARGTSWALIHLLSAVEVDFKDVLEKKNALVSLQQIIRELEGTQRTVWSPMVMNGSEFGLFANHSLVMSSYISRANAAIIDLRSLLVQG